MKTSRKYVVVVVLLAILAVVFGLAGTVMPIADVVTPQQSSSSMDSVAHFENPPTFDSGWVDIRTKLGQYIPISNGLNTSEVVVEIAGKQSLDSDGGTLSWSKTYGGTGSDTGYAVVQTSDGGYALVGSTNSFSASYDFWLIKTDSTGNVQWSKTYGGATSDFAESVVQTADGGYAIAGSTYSAAKKNDFLLVKTDPYGSMEWNNTYGDMDQDYARSVIQTSDGGYAIAGCISSIGAVGFGGYDFWLVKTNSTGTQKWNHRFGGSGWDEATSVIQTDDGGYAVAGRTTLGAGVNDFCLVKLNPNGAKQWNSTYGGTMSELAYAVVQTSDGGYAMAGQTSSYGAGGVDFYLVKADSNGNLEWDSTYGGGDNEYGRSFVQTLDGGYAIAGATASFGAGLYDFYLVKTDSSGNLQWNGTYGGEGFEQSYSIIQAADGKYILTGYSASFGAGGNDVWLIRVDGARNRVHQKNLDLTSIIPGWRRVYMGQGYDYVRSVVETDDGGYAIAGYTESLGEGDVDFWLIKTDSSGNMEWSRSYGGADPEYAYSVVQTDDGGFALAGTATPSGGPRDLLLVKTDMVGYLEWNETYGGVQNDYGQSIVQTDDGGYAIAGFTESPGNYDFWLVKTDSSGTMLWNKTYGGADGDYAQTVIQALDGGYAIAGITNSFGAGWSDFWLIKTDSSGDMQWNVTYGRMYMDTCSSAIQTFDGGYALIGRSEVHLAPDDLWLVKTDSSGTMLWNKTYSGTHTHCGESIVQTSDGGYALAGYVEVSIGERYFLLIKTDSDGNVQWSQTYGGPHDDRAYSVVEASSGGYVVAGHTTTLGADGIPDAWLIKTEAESGLSLVELTNCSIILYRGKTDPHWNYVRVRIWVIEEPTWMFGDINMDGVVDAKDLYILGRNYGQTFSLLSLSGIAAVAGIHTIKKRKQNKQPNQTS